MMDLSTVPDLVNHFAFATQFIPDLIEPAVRQAGNFMSAFSDDGGMSAGERIYRGGKVAVLGALFAVSVFTGNIEGAVATGVAEADEIRSLCHRGNMIRQCATTTASTLRSHGMSRGRVVAAVHHVHNG